MECFFPPIVVNQDVKAYLALYYGEKRLDDILSYLGNPPSFSSIRVNSLHQSSIELAEEILQKELSKQIQDRDAVCKEKLGKYGKIPETESEKWTIKKPNNVRDCLIIPSKSISWIKTLLKEVELLEIIVDSKVFTSVSRGSDIYAPGVLAASPGIQPGDVVKVVVDINNKSTKGEKIVLDDSDKLFAGYGVSLLSRSALFSTKNGVAVQMLDTFKIAPSIGNLDKETFFLQNFPSILVPHILGPKEGETIIDMCASPGGKTTHLAALMKNKGKIFALDKHESKVQNIRDLATLLNASCIIPLKADSTKLLQEKPNSEISTKKLKTENVQVHKFSPESMDRVLLDPPCSGIGQRPKIKEEMTLKNVLSCSDYQLKLFDVAFKLLRVGGTMVYSTCTINPKENEEVVRKVLDKYNSRITLVSQEPFMFGAPGLVWELTDELKAKGVDKGLSLEEAKLVQRFCPSSENPEHQIGFFVAKFVKLGS